MNIKKIKVNGIRIFSFNSKNQFLDYIGKNKNILVAVNAEKIVNNHNESTVTATGNVEIIQGKEVLRADYLEFDKIKNKAIVKGNVSILDEDGVVYFADYAEVDKGFKNGLTKNISILFIVS